MQAPLRLALSILALAAAGACAAPAPEAKAPAAAPVASRALYPNETPELRALINQYADRYGVPEDLVQRVVIRESRHNPEARNGPYYGLMQILPQTAGTMGYRGPASGLLDADTNLKYGVKYLRGAYLVARGHHDRTIHWYSSGYYYEAKRMGLLEETGLRS